MDVTTCQWHVGWGLIVVGLLSGAMIGLGFHRESFLGGYLSFRRRLVRLGHIACIALGTANVAVAIWIAGLGVSDLAVAQGLMMLGGLAMPTICFLAAWRTGFRHLFAIPVLSLLAGVVGLWWKGWV